MASAALQAGTTPTGRTLFALVALAFLSGALVHPLSGEVLDISGATAGGESKGVQYLGAAVYLATVGMLVLYRIRVPPLAAVALPAAICALAMLSTMWSIDPGLTLRRSIALTGTTIFAAVFAGMFDERGVLTILTRFFVLYVLAMALVAVVAPGMAFHQASDPVFGEHAGRLRGTYAHKNDLGHYLGLAICVLVAIGDTDAGRAWRRVGIVVGAGLLVISGSVSSMISTAGALAVLALVLIYFRTANAMLRALLIVFLGIVVPVVLFIAFWTPALVVVLEFFGRDPTLTARTDIWRYVIIAGEPTWLLGAGYGAGWQKAAPILAASPFLDPGNAHNGYLQGWLEIGVVGVGMALAYVVVAGRAALRQMAREPGHRTAVLAFAVVAYFTIVNIAGPYIANHNDMLWATLVVVTILTFRRQGAPATARARQRPSPRRLEPARR
jgi:exopolysaccharide production protein ExoQ